MQLVEGHPQYVQGSSVKPYELKNVGGVYSCTCHAWRIQKAPIDKRTCKHLIGLLGKESEMARIGSEHVVAKTTPKKNSAPPVKLAVSVDDLGPGFNLTGYWMSEKLDGVRAYWDGENFISRQGNVFHAPAWFKKDMPWQPVDGELWIDRKMFQHTISIVRRMDGGDQWKVIKFKAFDLPQSKEMFEERQKLLGAIVDLTKNKHLMFVKQTRANSADHVNSFLKEIVDSGGEGIMLCQPQSAYESGRGSTILKKKLFSEAEFEVVGHEKGRGKHNGVVGGLIVKFKDGRTFHVGSGLTDDQRANPPKIGSMVTCRYTELTDGGLPKCTSFVCERDYE